MDKFIDVIVISIKFKVIIDDLIELEFVYVLFFLLVKLLVNMLGFIG